MTGGTLLVIIMISLGILLPRPFFADRKGAAVNTADVSALAATPSRDQTILVLSSPIHTDLALPATPEVLERFAFMAPDGLDPAQPGVGYIVAGWGGRGFYIETPTWSDLKPGPLFSAVTIDRSVMHMALAGAIDADHPSVMAIELDGAAFARLLDAVLAGFAGADAAAPAVVAGAQYGEYDLFYEAEGWFNAVVGCNLWTARMLRRAGLRSGWWTPLPQLLTASLRLHNPPSVFAYKPVAR